jgi:TolA-binding protein
MNSRRRISLTTLFVMAATLCITGCAYFNTLYNAEKKYKEAQKAERAATQAQTQPQFDDATDLVITRRQTAVPIGVNKDTYEQVIVKCKHVIARYPDSRHVDDAMLLIGKSLFALQRYDESVAALDSLTSRYPKTNLREEAEFLKGKGLVKGQHYDAAVTALSEFIEEYRGSDERPEAFYLLCTSLMELGLADNAVAALTRLEKDHGRSEYRYRTQTDMAGILIDKGLYQQSLAVYERLNRSRIPSNMRYDVWMGMSRSQVELGQYREALVTLDKISGTNLPPNSEPEVLLLRARAFAGADSIPRAITTYGDVAKRFGRGTYGAEANYRLGILYESMDSLKTAQKFYQEVPKAFSGSEFAEESIKRSADIGRVLRLQETAGDDSPEAIVLRTFSMAEIQLVQFNNTEKAIPSYEKIVNEFPDSEFAPKSAYALGYIYGVVLQDSVKAREWYDVLRTRYGDTQQAQLAYAFYKGATPPPPFEEMMRYGAPKRTATIVPPDTSRFAVPPPDTTRVLPDSLLEPVPQPVDTTSAPADTSDAELEPVPQPVDTTSAPPDTSDAD